MSGQSYDNYDPVQRRWDPVLVAAGILGVLVFLPALILVLTARSLGSF